MSLMDYFRTTRKASANVAKERLQIIIAHERRQEASPDYLPVMQREIIDVITKYVKVDREAVKVALDRVGDSSVLELNVTLPETTTAVED